MNQLENPKGGYTLVEATIAITLLAVLMGLALTSSRQGLGAVQSTVTLGELNTSVSRGMARIVQEIETLGDATLDPDLITPTGLPTVTSDSIEFRKGLDFQAGAPVWGNVTRIAFVTDPNEVVNGLDDDDDGSVDEGSVVVTYDVDTADPQSVTIAKRVRGYLQGELLNGLDDNGNGLPDERGLVFTRERDVLNIQLTIEHRGPGGNLIPRTLRTSLRIRN